MAKVLDPAIIDLVSQSLSKCVCAEKSTKITNDKCLNISILQSRLPVNDINFFRMFIMLWSITCFTFLITSSVKTSTHSKISAISFDLQ